MTAKVDDRATPEEIGKMLQPHESMVPSTETEHCLLYTSDAADE